MIQYYKKECHQCYFHIVYYSLSLFSLIPLSDPIIESTKNSFIKLRLPLPPTRSRYRYGSLLHWLLLRGASLVNRIYLLKSQHTRNRCILQRSSCGPPSMLMNLKGLLNLPSLYTFVSRL